MRSKILAGLVLGTFAWATLEAPRALGQGATRILQGEEISNVDANRNFVLNPSGDTNLNGVSVAGGATISRTTVAPTLGARADVSVSIPAAGTVAFAVATTPTSGSCSVKFKYSGFGTGAVAEVMAGSNVVGSANLSTPVTGSLWANIPLVPCNAISQVRVRSATGTQAGKVGRVTVSEASIQSGLVAQATEFGRLEWAPAASCFWGAINNGSLSNIAADANCSNPTAFGNVTAPGTKVPAVTANVQPGKYLVKFVGNFQCIITSSNTNRDCVFGISDGSVKRGISQINAYSSTNLNYIQNIPVVEGVFEYNTAQTVTWSLQSYSSGANGIARYDNSQAGGSFATFNQAIVQRFPSNSETVVTPSSQNYIVDAVIVGDNPNLGGSDVSDYAEIVNASLTMVPKTFSAPVSIPCNGVNGSGTPSIGSTTCATGTESIGASFIVPTAGLYEACFDFSHYTQYSASGTLATAFQVIETPVNAVTTLQEGASRQAVDSGINATFTEHRQGKPVTSCGIFNFASAGQKTLRLMYEQDVSTGLALNSILADASGTVGSRNIRITVRPVFAGQTPVYVQAPVKSSGSGVAPKSDEVSFDTTSAVTTATNVGATGTWFDATTVPLPAGTYDVTGYFSLYRNGATMSFVKVELGFWTAAGNSGVGAVENENYQIMTDGALSNTALTSHSFSLPNVRVVSDGTNLTIAGSTTSGNTLRFKANVHNYTAGNPQYRARIKATLIK